jgi:hypothetical protein
VTCGTIFGLSRMSNPKIGYGSKHEEENVDGCKRKKDKKRER